MSGTFVALALATLSSSTLAAQSIDWHNAEAVAGAAVRHHPAVSDLNSQIAATRERARSLSAYPNPMVMAGVEDLQTNLSNDEMMTMYMVGASQTIPRRSRREALRRSEELVATSIELQAKSLSEEIRRDALFAYYDLAAADSRIEATKQLAAAADAVIAAARAHYEAGATIQADVIRAQLQRTEVEHQLLTLGGERRIAAARLVAQLGLPLTTAVPRLHLSHQTGARRIDAPLTISDDHPAVAALAAGARRNEEQVRLARLLAKPDWIIEASYGMRPEERDMFSVVASVELPLRKSSTIEPQVRAAIADREGTLHRAAALRRQILADLGVAHAVHDEATKQHRLHEEVLVPQSKLAFEATLAAYEAGKATFESVLMTQLATLRIERDYYEILARHIKAVVDFEALQRGARRGAIGGMNAAMPDAPGSAMPPSTPSRDMGAMR